MANDGSSGLVMAIIWNLAGKLKGRNGIASSGLVEPLWDELRRVLDRPNTLRLELPSVIKITY